MNFSQVEVENERKTALDLSNRVHGLREEVQVKQGEVDECKRQCVTLRQQVWGWIPLGCGTCGRPGGSSDEELCSYLCFLFYWCRPPLW